MSEKRVQLYSGDKHKEWALKHCRICYTGQQPSAQGANTTPVHSFARPRERKTLHHEERCQKAPENVFLFAQILTLHLWMVNDNVLTVRNERKLRSALTSRGRLGPNQNCPYHPADAHEVLRLLGPRGQVHVVHHHLVFSDAEAVAIAVDEHLR